MLSIALLGCGRVGFPANSRMAVTADESTIHVDVPGRFALTFDEAYNWQASSWMNLSSSAAEELAGGAGDALEEQVLQAPFAVMYGGRWYTLDSVDWADRNIRILDADRIVIEIGYEWQTTDESYFEVNAVYEIPHGRNLDGRSLAREQERLAEALRHRVRADQSPPDDGMVRVRRRQLARVRRVDGSVLRVRSRRGRCG